MAKLKNAFFIGITAAIGLCTALINTAAAEPKAATAKPAARQQYHSRGSIHLDAVAKPERLHQVQISAAVGAQADDVAGVGRDFGLV